MFCMNCGARNDASARFCAKCGKPLDDFEPTAAAPDASGGADLDDDDDATVLSRVPHTQPEQPGTAAERNGAGETDAPMPQPAVATAQTAVAQQPTATAQPATAQEKLTKKQIILTIAAVVAIALIATGGMFLTHRAGLWGAKTIPDVSAIKPADGKKLTANIVAQQLNDQGITTEVKKVYSGKDVGTFAGLDGVKTGDRISAGQTVTVNESMGPGVPQGTVGKTATDIVATLKTMDVPVRYKQVVVNDTTKTKPGTVIATYPNDGAPVVDTKTGISVGVATKGDGIGYDIIGTDKNQAKSTLESKGYSVTLQPKFSSKQYVGKIAGSNPAPGTPLESGDSVTLYYGIDASQTTTVFTKTMDGQKVMANPGDFMTGTYCKSDNTTCITLDMEKLNSGSEYSYLFNAADNDGQSRMLTASRSYQSYGMPPSDSSNAGLLINGKTGTFELFPLSSVMGDLYCGSEPMGDSPGVSCVNGTKVTGSTSPSSGLVRRMDAFYLYFPVGADVNAVESSGYFDADALAKARKQKAVDTSRPFIVVRDKSLYDKSETEISNASQSDPNPFMPADPNAGKTAKTVKMKPAPSDGTVYYLSEGGDTIDWDSLTDADVKGAGDSTGSTSDSSGADAASKKIFAELAGSEYTFAASGDGSLYSLMTLKSDGTFSGTTYAADLSDSKYSVATAPRKELKFSGRFSSAAKGSGGTYTLQCDAGALKTVDGTHAIQAGFDPCGKFTAYPAGTSYDTFGTGVQSVLLNRGESESGPKDWIIVNQGIADDSIPGTYERTKK
ncbi:PASTA domain-containing protein [Bifidobacterium sp. 82T24]|uniref:PASTA domain-containing protein n=1 Tax=Bifidobacterium pluvialisilvae TaxID=2834436 RepID=UPI001C59B05A|nr:PASTA domain-containing protein [Bifidobacterium pluvialisilvae]MBW3088555.1 PASTA domain-containing protein [Bifidobacterium pluvialisilvae]